MSRLSIQETRINGRICPLGVDAPEIVFSWRFGPGEGAGLRQSAYRIVVFAGEDGAIGGRGIIWDSGRVAGGRHVDIRYEGAPLLPRQRCYYTVTVWDGDGKPAESGVSWWEMGLLREEEWTASWIRAPYPEQDAGRQQPMPQFRQAFDVRKPLQAARAYVSGLGHYELRLNGGKVGDYLLDPGWTEYDAACLYTVYDVTDQLKQGANAVGLLLGNGFYNVEGGRYTKFKDSYGKPAGRVQLELTYADGSSDVVGSDVTWQVSASPLVFSCMYGGEDYDARLEQPGWDHPGFGADAGWAAAVEAEPPAGRLQAQATLPLKAMKRLAPVSFTEPRPGVYVADFGQNFSGWVRIAASGPSGREIVLTPAEVLTDGLPDQTHSGSPYRFSYTLKGESTEEWTPRFTYYGFRYVQIEGAVPAGLTQAGGGAGDHGAAQATLLELEGEMIYPDTVLAGSFESSDPLLNRIHEIIDWAILSNMKSVFTDCPHREKLGWLEEAHLMEPSILFNYDAQAQFTKVMADMRDAQLPDGMVPTTAPEYVVFQPPWDVFRHSVPWGGAYVIVGWELIQRCGDVRTVREHYDGMKRYVDYLTRSCVDGIVQGGLGDWYDIGPNGPGFSQATSVPMVETAFYYHLVTLMERIADLLGKPGDSSSYAALGAEIKRTFNRTYYNAEAGRYDTGSQAAQAIPLVFGLAEAAWEGAIAEVLIGDIVGRGFHTTAGDVGHRYVLLALSRLGRDDLIFRMSQNTDHPSYGYQIVHGATTLTEAWDGPTVGHSQNHLMLGHLEEWLYTGLAGIDYRFDIESQQFMLTIKPYMPEDLQWVEAWHDMPAGRVQVRWERGAAGSLKLSVQVPPNVAAEVHVPAASEEAASVRKQPAGDEPLQRGGFERAGQGAVVFRTGAGAYEFASRL